MKKLPVILLLGFLVSVFHACDTDDSSNQEIAADFYADKTEIESGESVQFFDNSSSQANSWYWQFEGGYPETSNEQNPVVTFYDAGTFDVSLSVIGQSNSDQATKSDYITVTQSIERSSYAAKWIVSNSKSQRIVPTDIQKDRSNKTSISSESKLLSQPNLKPNIPDGWDDAIIVKNQSVDGADYMWDDDISQGDDLYVAFSYINDSDYDITTDFYISIYIDGVEVVTKYQQETVYAGYYWRHWNYYAGVADLSGGYHTISMEIDSYDYVSESYESDNIYSKTFYVEGDEPPAAAYSSFEFLESRYIVTKTDGTVIYGDLSEDYYSETTLYLDYWATIYIQSVSDTEIVFELYDSKKSTTSQTITAYKDTEFAKTDMTELLTYDVWILESTTGSNDVGEEWIFTKSGTYFFTVSGYEYTKYWNYIDETSFAYGFTPSATDGTASITNITFTELDIEDSAGTLYSFKRYY